MKIITNETVAPAERSDVLMKTLFGRDKQENQNLTMGTVVFPPGARVPAQGTGAHGEHEFSYVISGSLLTMSGGREYRIRQGQATWIPAGEEHWAYNDGTENCEILWVLAKP